MSEFDKEREREKLRKQFERDEARRESTQKMSELLLKGAKMLNAHCGECASPIFQYEGEEFCPTCGKSVGELQQAGETVDPASDGETSDESSNSARQIEPSPSESIDEPHSPVSTPPPARDPGQAEAALQDSIVHLANHAATADDPRLATEFLEAAKVAGETIVLLQQNNSSG